MKLNVEKFEKHLIKIESIFTEAKSQEDPAKYIYSVDARTPFFMLEGLSRLYGNFHNKSKFEKLKEHFKLIEDALGAIDYYDVYAKNYKQQANIPDSIKQYMEHHRDEMFVKLNKILILEGWLDPNSKRIQKIRKTLSEIKWLKEKDEVDQIKKLYIKEIKSICEFIKKYAKPYTEMELHVHEIRRDLRWLSIYPQALNGQIQFAKNTGSEIETSPFLTDEVIQSKYNRFPEPGNATSFLLLEKNYFYSLSWLIAELGDLKDEGLEYYALVEAIQKIDMISPLEASEKAIAVLGWEEDKIPSLLLRANEITRQFLEKGLLQKLIFGTSRILKYKD